MPNLVEPLPLPFLSKMAGDLFGPLASCDCSSVFFVAGGGKRTLIKYFLGEKEMIRRVLGERFDRTLLVFVNPDYVEDATSEAYLELMKEAMIDEARRKGVEVEKEKQLTGLTGLKQAVKQVTDQGLTVVFILTDFEFTLSLPSSIYRNLEAVMAVNKSRVTYMFLAGVNLLDREVVGRLHNLKYAVSQKVSYFPMLDRESASYVLEKHACMAGVKLTEKVRDVVLELAGGHPQLLKYSGYILKDKLDEGTLKADEVKRVLLDNKQLEIVCGDVWEGLSQHEQEVLLAVVRTGQVPAKLKRFVDYVVGTGLIKKKGNGWIVCGELLEQQVRSRVPQEELTYDAKTDQIYYGITSCGDVFTKQEFGLMKFFLEKEGLVVSRDEVGEVLWGKNADDKYSDWHIDKVMSMIRKKLEKLGFPVEKLATLKGRGFRFAN